jgi:hypothetical protein
LCSRSPSPPAPTASAALPSLGSHVAVEPQRQHSPLNSDATPFSPSPSPSRTAGEELPEWLLFSPSSFDGRSPASGRLSDSSLALSFTEVVAGKGKSSVATPGLDLGRSKGKEPMGGSSSSGLQGGHGRPSPAESGVAGRSGGFMADARRAASSGRHSPALASSSAPMSPNDNGLGRTLFQLLSSRSCCGGLHQCRTVSSVP